MLFNATFFYKLGSGPVWPLLAENERTSCRNNWWTNVLYVNNFISTSEPVSHHWKVSTFRKTSDELFWHFFILFTVYATCMVFSRWFSIDNHGNIYSNANLAIHQIDKSVVFDSDGNIICCASCYYIYLPIWWNVHGCTRVCVLYCIFLEIIWENRNCKHFFLLIFFRSTRYSHLFDSMYKTIYIPWYTNTGSFVLGMIGGLVWCKHKQGLIDLSKSKVIWSTH